MDLQSAVKAYQAGELTGNLKNALEELARRGEVDIDISKPEYQTKDVPTALLRGTYSGALGLLGLPVTAAESALKLANIGLEAAGVPESVRLPVSEKGLVRTVREGLADVGPGYTIPSMETVAPRVRPAAVAGEVLGASIAPAVAPVAAARAGFGLPSALRSSRDLEKAPGLARRIGRDIVESAARRPVPFVATEAGLAGLAAGGGAVAETLAPGDPTAQVIGQIAPTLSPAILMSRGVNSFVQNAKDAIAARLPGGIKATAAEKVKKAALDYGEDPEVLARKLLESPEVDSLTAAQIADSPFLTALEGSIIKESATTGQQYKTLAQNTAEEMNRLYRDALGTGNPDTIAVVAAERKNYFNTLLENKVSRAEDAARLAQEPVAGRLSEEEVSEKAREILESALKDARTTEGQLWSSVPKNIEISPENLASQIRTYRSEIMDERVFPAPAQQFANRVLKSFDAGPDGASSLIKQVFGDEVDVPISQDPIYSSDLLDFRSVALRKARAFASGANPDFDMARIMRGLANASLDDLGTLPGNQADIARDFSKRLNEKFGRTFAADVLGVGASGRARVEPEMTLRRAMAVRGPQAEIRARQLEEAVEPISVRGQDVTPEIAERPAEMREAQKQFLLTMVNELRDASTQALNPNKLEDFISRNQRTIQRLGVEDLFSDINKTARTFDSAKKIQSAASANFDKKKMAAKILKTEDTNEFVAKIMRGANPSKELSEMFRLVRNSPDAVEGLKVSIFENIFDNAVSRETGVFSGDAVESYLKRPVGNTTIEGALKSSGALNKNQIDRIKIIAGQAKKFEKSYKSKDTIEDFFKNESHVFKLLARVMGARFGANSLAARQSGAQLIFASEGSKAAQTFLSKIPNSKVLDVLTEAAINNPKLMAELLKSPSTVPGIAKNNAQIEAYLLQAGIQETDED